MKKVVPEKLPEADWNFAAVAEEELWACLIHSKVRLWPLPGDSFIFTEIDETCGTAVGRGWGYAPRFRPLAAQHRRTA